MKLRDRVVEMYVRGDRVKMIASELDVSTSFIENLIYRKFSNENLIQKRKASKINKLKKIKNQRELGVKVSTIAHDLDVCELTVYRAMKKIKEGGLSA